MNLARTVPSINEQWFQFKISREIRLKFRIFADSVDYGCGFFYPWWKKEDGGSVASAFGKEFREQVKTARYQRIGSNVVASCGVSERARLTRARIVLVDVFGSA